MDNQPQPQPQTPAPSLNNHVSADDLKKIRGGIASGSVTGIRARVEKSDEDFPAPAM